MSLAQRPNAKINLILPDPDNARVVQELARRFNYKEDAVRRGIHESEKFFKNLAERASMPKGRIKVWYLSEAPLYTFYRFDNIYVFASYRHSGKGKLPTIVCQKGGIIADFIDEQMEAMLNRKDGLAKQVFPAKDQSLNPGVIQTDTVNVPLEGEIKEPAPIPSGPD